MTDRPVRGTALACTLAFLAPWAVLTFLLPPTWRWGALALLVAIGGLLYAAAIWSGMRAKALGLDPEGWAFAAVVSIGFAMIVLMTNPRPRPKLAYLCGECGREGHIYEPFCFACGSVAG